ncbi:hypothetical protein N9P98_02985 [Flavobacteriaceae bacterium]|jgi:hypothetical protein|nr:hypothetical protein [Flavobacteriaceae bacterium]MDA9886030.1 hypothetical protein [Flavobacteriaceae bacterium]MDB4186892.1 hypothetical protein [Flavobacteriaceae bacterium]MDC1402447.1 hypothetical protein [Flavobacteriaceae bacterium]
MKLSKKELSLLLELIYGIILIFLFLPHLKEFKGDLFLNLNASIGFVIALVITSIVYFAVGFTLIELFYRKKKKDFVDERELLIDLKLYKWGFYLYEIVLTGLFVHLIIQGDFSSLSKNILFYAFTFIISISIVKSLSRLILYRTT